MGCDIHCVWQAKKDGAWIDIESDYEQNRQYLLFAVLANVRNGYDIEPIADTRGLPADFAMTDDEEHVGISGKSETPYATWMGDHSHTWLSGEEMIAWSETAPTITRKGVISREQYATWKKGTSPEGWSGAISGQTVHTIEETDVEGEEGWTRDALDQEWSHIRVSWPANLGEELAYFFDEVKRLVGVHGEIRLVCGFDS